MTTHSGRWQSSSSRHNSIGLVAGLATFVLMLGLPAPSGVSEAGWNVAALATLMVIWWISEALPLAATALAPVVILPMLGDRPLESVAQSYAHPLIFLFLGGFFIGKTLQRWNLHSKIATELLKLAPRSAEGIIGAIMVTTAFLSMWISNTATALVMVSIAQSITQGLGTNVASSTQQSDKEQFSAALILGVAFAATIGGMATIIGTPPNALLVAYLQISQDISIGFGQWMGVGLPLVIVLLPLTWFLLTRIVFRVSNIDSASIGYRAQGNDPPPLAPGARIVAAVSLLAALALITRPFVEKMVPGLGISDAGILMAAALIMFILPAPGSGGERLLRWEDAEKIRWDVVILFSGGLALANAVQVSGLAESLGSLFSAAEVLPVALLLLIAMIIIVLLGELASNTAIAAIFLPIVGAAAIGLGIPPLELVIPVGLAASLGFMLPVATPPNAIAYGTGDITSGQLLKAGALLDIIGIVVVYAIAVLLGPIVFG